MDVSWRGLGAVRGSLSGRSYLGAAASRGAGQPPAYMTFT